MTNPNGVELQTATPSVVDGPNFVETSIRHHYLRFERNTLTLRTSASRLSMKGVLSTSTGAPLPCSSIANTISAVVDLHLLFVHQSLWRLTKGW